MSPKKRRSRGSGRSLPKKTVLVTLVVLLLFGWGSPTASFSLGESDRGTSVAVTDDTNGLVGLNKTSELKEGASDNCLVGVTNQLDESATVDVSLGSSSGDLGSLKVGPNGTLEGNSVEFSLNDGASETVYMDVDAGTAGNTTYYSVNVSTSGVQGILAERSAPIKGTAGKTCD